MGHGFKPVDVDPACRSIAVIISAVPGYIVAARRLSRQVELYNLDVHGNLVLGNPISGVDLGLSPA